MKTAPAKFTIRPFESTDSDYAALVKLSNQDWPNNPSTVELWKQNDSKRKPKHLSRRYIGEIETENGKQIVALGFVSKRGLSEGSGKYNIKFRIDEEFKDHGFDEPLYTHMIADLANEKPIALKTEVQERHTYRVQLFQQQGFQESIKPKRYCQLEVSSFEVGLLAGYSEKVAASGIVITNVQKLKTYDSNWMQKFYDMDTAIEQQISNANEFKFMEFDEYIKMFEDKNFLADAQFVAVDGDKYVGLSSLWPDPVCKDLLYVGTTRVLQSHRRRGIATALKLKTIAFAQAYGANTIQTRNKVNSPMYALNMKLGFEPGIVLLTLEKVL